MQTVWLLLAVSGVVLAGWTAYQTVFMVVGLVSTISRREGGPARVVPARIVVLVPAHNEGALITATVRSLTDCDYPPELRDIIVIADNCTDDTAAAARAAGATCFERQDMNLRGKPYALDWMIRQLDVSRYDALVIIDGDTRVGAQFLRTMDQHLAAGEQAIQGYYGVMNPHENWLTSLGVLPAAVKFRFHFPGKRALGLSCPLAGNGMCFSSEIIRRFGWNAFSITENWEYYAILTLHGYVTTSAEDAVIYAQVAKSLKLGQTQRMRWMKGQIDTAARYWRPLLKAGLCEPNPVKLDALVEVLRPSHANLLFGTVLLLVLSCAAWLSGAAAMAPLALLGALLLLLQALYFAVGIAVERPPLRTYVALGMVPWYLAWKVFVSIKGLLTLNERAWVKTTRN